MSEDKVTDTERLTKEADTEVVIDNKFFKCVENFWFYHKWHLLIALIAVVLVFIVVDQITVREKDDIVILTAGPYKPSATQTVAIRDALASVIPSDFNGDGEKIVTVAHTEVYSKEQILEYQEQYKQENGESAIINSSMNAENLKGFHNLIMAGEYSVCIIDEWLYEDVREAGGFRPLSELFPEGVPQGAVDEYAVRFKDTAFARSFDCFKGFPDSTLICLRTQGVVSSLLNKGSSSEAYLQAEETFKAILDFKAAE